MPLLIALHSLLGVCEVLFLFLGLELLVVFQDLVDHVLLDLALKILLYEPELELGNFSTR
jgi:hypothetical protein